MELGPATEQAILVAIRKIAHSTDYGQVIIKLDKTAPRQEIVIETQEKIRVEKEA
ncbi:MAG: hypothetical protein FWH12_02390 [Treponema sp.]|nr:hypothetical protein [Treponema sp.]